ATGCLLECGHRRIAMITGPSSWRSVRDRAQGYARALEAVGIDYEPGLIAEGGWAYQGGYQAMQELPARGRTVSALFAQNDRMAIGAMHALREVGLRVPHDVSVVGYDDIPVAEYYDPPLTTIRQPMQEVGALATRLLIQAIEEPGMAKGEILL